MTDHESGLSFNAVGTTIGKPRPLVRRMHLWHHESPGIHMDVDVRFPRYLFPIKFATLTEVLSEYRRRKAYR